VTLQTAFHFISCDKYFDKREKKGETIFIFSAKRKNYYMLVRRENFHGKLSFHYTLKCRFLPLSHSQVPPASTFPVVTSALTQSSSGFACHINSTNLFDTLAICKCFSKSWGRYCAEVAREESGKS
jgi:hypothetical protein